MFANNPKCPFCGSSDVTRLRDDRCLGCGRFVADKHCPICRRERTFSSDAQVEGCWYCGAIFNASQNLDGSGGSLLLEEGLVEKAGFVSCENCGSRMAQSEIFCQKCGSLKSR